MLNYHAMKTLAVDGPKWSASRPVRFTHGNSFRCPLARRLCGPQRKQSHHSPCLESNPESHFASLHFQL